MSKPGSPGWYPDDAGRMRRWDGSRWTGEVRELPPWMAGEGQETMQAARRRRLAPHWIVLGVVTAALFVGISVKAWTAAPNLPDRTVFDADFIAAANAKCRASLTPLKEQRPQPGTPEGRDPGPHEKVAARVDETADQLVVIADDLRRIPVDAVEDGAVQGWLDEWDNYAAIGHQYADAVRDDSKAQEDLIRRGAESSRRADAFAQANKLKDCTLA